MRLIISILILSQSFVLATQQSQASSLSPVTFECVEKTCLEFDLPLALIMGIMATEKGQVGKISKNKNGTYDIGPMQINSIWLPKLKAVGISEPDLLNDGCVNVLVAGWLMRSLLKNSSTPTAIAHYHSRTPRLGARYLAAVKQRLYTLDVDATINYANRMIVVKGD
ncbi:MAG: lytic transglycosylase domain-containing protein [Candidatus Adiutrix sp.]